jgi:hypothetical protein
VVAAFVTLARLSTQIGGKAFLGGKAAAVVAVENSGRENEPARQPEIDGAVDASKEK